MSKNNVNRELIFALAGDNNYINYIETTIKSILYHHTNCKIYVLNEDILPEWFQKVNHLAVHLNSSIINVKLCNENIEWSGPHDYINKMTYARYFIPKYVSEDKVLYLDSDVIVAGNLEKLFELEFENYLIAGVKDYYEEFQNGNLDFINAGVLLINNKEWRNKNLERSFIQRTYEILDGDISYNGIFLGDQTVINQVCKGKILFLEGDYNIQVSSYRDIVKYNIFTPVTKNKIIHFLSADKPWNSMLQMPFKDKWWYYNSLDYSEIISHSKKLSRESIMKNKICFILTNSQDFENIEFLLKELPDYLFFIAAYTDFGSRAIQLQSYSNVRLYPRIIDVEIENLLADCDFYLNINHGGQVSNIINRAKIKNKRVLSFDSIDGKESADIVFESSNPSSMVQFLRDNID